MYVCMYTQSNFLIYVRFNYRDVHSIATRRDKVIAATMIILAVVTSAIAISSNIYSLTGNKS